MNLRDLHYLLAVAELRNFGQAAERCFISQPTLSMQIKKLEEELGVQLFERSNKKVLPTEVGEQIIVAARRMLQEERLIKETALTAQHPLAGNLRLAAFPTLAPYLFPALVPLIRQQLPNIRLMLVEEKTEPLLQQLSSGQIDAALLALPVADDSLQVMPLFTDEFLLALACDHALAGKTAISMHDLQGEDLLLLDEGHCLRGQALQVCQLAGVVEAQDVRATSLETLRQMVRAGTGVTFMPGIAVREEAGICYRPFQGQAPSRTIALVWRKTTARSALFEVIGGLIRTLSV
jgi:LysR family transcriptional regulator, hydrogen peroxide-inducible genes activator